MRYYIDTEFSEYPCTIDLISIAIVAQDNREYYAISNEFDESMASAWVKDNVIMILPDKDDPAWKSRAEIRKDIMEFVGDDQNPEFWGYYCDYDWVSFCWLFGRMIDLPKVWPKYCLDLKQMLNRLHLRVPFQAEHKHDALSDANWNKRAHEWAIKEVTSQAPEKD